jgi:hypothetical protein
LADSGDSGYWKAEDQDHYQQTNKAITALETELAKPDFWEGYVPEPVKPAQQEPKIDIYRSFEQWKCGNVLEHGVPRTEHYSEAQLDLVEMGWNYGYDAGRAVEQALDKKAENARELGLDYEPAQQEPVAWVPYLSDRADGVKGHYAIARWNPRGYREVWNLRRHEWGAYSDDVLSLEEADTLLRLITIPTRKVTSPQPAQQEPVAWMSPHGGFLSANYINNFASGLDKEIHNIPLYTLPPAQRTWVGLDDKDYRELHLQMGPTYFYQDYGRAIEAKLRSKNEDRN